MPAKKGGGLRKGQEAKKAEIERLINESKKSKLIGPLKPPPGRFLHGKYRKQPAPHLKQASDKTAVVRLPLQQRPTLANPKHVLFNPAPPIPIPKAKPVPNPNRVIVRLPPAVNSSLFPSKPRNPTSFTDLPGEIRNKIYDSIFPRQLYEIRKVLELRKQTVELTYHLPYSNTGPDPAITPFAARRRRLFDLPRRLHSLEAIPPYALSPGPAALLLTCKQINSEATSVFYSKSSFAFTTMRPLSRFLSLLRPLTKTYIKSLTLMHHTASLPPLVKDNLSKHRHDRLWADICWTIAADCESLEDFTLHLRIHDKPFETGARAGWMDPLYAFMDLRFRKCDIKLRHCFPKNNNVLEVEAYELRKALMSENFQEPGTQERERAFGALMAGRTTTAKQRRKVGVVRIVP
ncbi:MAG: hypothetical protein Q9190_002561 [Brigantiaea leucoxantha]